MIWSKKISLFESLLASPLKGKLKIRTAAYRKAYEERGRTWIEFEKNEIISFCDFTAENEWKKTSFKDPKIKEKGIYSKSEFGYALGEYLQLGIDEALNSENDIVRGLAFLDRRVGARTLKKIDRDKLGVVSSLLFTTRTEKSEPIDRING